MGEIVGRKAPLTLLLINIIIIIIIVIIIIMNIYKFLLFVIIVYKQTHTRFERHKKCKSLLAAHPKDSVTLWFLLLFLLLLLLFCLIVCVLKK